MLVWLANSVSFVVHPRAEDRATEDESRLEYNHCSMDLRSESLLDSMLARMGFGHERGKWESRYPASLADYVGNPKHHGRNPVAFVQWRLPKRTFAEMAEAPVDEEVLTDSANTGNGRNEMIRWGSSAVVHAEDMLCEALLASTPDTYYDSQVQCVGQSRPQ